MLRFKDVVMATLDANYSRDARYLDSLLLGAAGGIGPPVEFGQLTNELTDTFR